MASFLKEYPQFSEYYYWNVLTVEKRTVMLADAVRIKYDKVEKSESKKEEKVEEKKLPEGGSLADFLQGKV